MRQVSKKEFDAFLNYFQDRSITTSIMFKSTTFFDNFDMELIGEFRDNKYYIND